MSTWYERSNLAGRWCFEFPCGLDKMEMVYKIMIATATSESNLRALYNHPEFPDNAKLFRSDFEHLVEFWKTTFPHRAINAGNKNNGAIKLQDLWLVLNSIPDKPKERLRGYYLCALGQKAKTHWHAESSSCPYRDPKNIFIRLDDHGYTSGSAEKLIIRIFDHDFDLKCFASEQQKEIFVRIEIHGDELDEPLTYKILTEFPDYESTFLSWDVEGGHRFCFCFRIPKDKIHFEPSEVRQNFKVWAFDPQPGFERKLVFKLIEGGIPVSGIKYGTGPYKEPHLVAPEDLFESMSGSC